jgi:type IV pilus assembly protein PilW
MVGARDAWPSSGIIFMKINNHGFTLAELLVAMAISGVVISAIYATYQAQQKAYMVQEEVAAMQQKLRAAMYYMTQQIQHAGCDPTGEANAGIITANANEIEFTADVRGDSFGSSPLADDSTDTDAPYEHVTYSLYTSEGIQKLGVKSTATASNQPVAEYVDALNFVYLDANGGVTANIDEIRSVLVTLVVRAEREDRDYLNTNAYPTEPNPLVGVVLPAQNDHYRRRGATVHIKCRNLGL